MTASCKIRCVARRIEAHANHERARVIARVRSASAYARTLAPVVAWSEDERAWFRRPLSQTGDTL